MNQGLQIFNENGICTLDVTDRLTRVLGEFETGTSNGSLVDNNLLSGTPWFISIPSVSAVSFDSNSISITFSSNSISWEFVGYFSTPGNHSHHIIYGVY